MKTISIYYATGNNGKFEMVKEFIKNNSESIDLKQLNIDLKEEQNINLEEIAISKAKQAWEILRQPVIVDDSGIYFNKYKDFPGFMTKYIYKCIGFEGLYKLYDEGDSATFKTFIVYIYGPDQYKVFIGSTDGILIKPKELPKDSNLPYTKLFIPIGSDKTLEECQNKSGFSEFNPRIIAMKMLLNYLLCK